MRNCVRYGILMALAFISTWQVANAGQNDVFGRIGSVKWEGRNQHDRLIGGGISCMIKETIGIFGEYDYIPMKSGSASIKTNEQRMLGGVRFYGSESDAKARLYVPLVLGRTAWRQVDDSVISVFAFDRAFFYGIGLGIQIIAGKTFGLRSEIQYNRAHNSGVSISGHTIGFDFFYRFGKK